MPRGRDQACGGMRGMNAFPGMGEGRDWVAQQRKRRDGIICLVRWLHRQGTQTEWARRQWARGRPVLRLVS